MMMITDPRAPAVQALLLRGHLRLLAAGMRNSRLSGKEILRRASAVTGKAYARGQYQRAIDDLTTIINANKES